MRGRVATFLLLMACGEPVVLDDAVASDDAVVRDDADTSPDAGRDAAVRDAFVRHDVGTDAACFVRCGPPQLVCAVGVIQSFALDPASCTCELTPVSIADPCARGCRDGAMTYGDPSELCIGTAPAREGAVCATDDDCQPSFPLDDGFGGLYTPPLTCFGLRCRGPAFEACDTTDDDHDGMIDEGCVCHPRVIATGLPSYPSAAFGGSRVALAWSPPSGGGLAIHSAIDGTLLGSRSNPMGDALLSRFDGGFVFVERGSGATGSLVEWRDDDTTSVAALPFPVPIALRRWGTGYFVIPLLPGTSAPAWTLTRYDASLHVVGSTVVTPDRPSQFALTVLPTGEPLLITGPQDGTLGSFTMQGWRISDDRVAHEAFAREALGYPYEIAATADRAWVVGGTSGAQLSSIDPTADRWAQRFAIPRADSTFAETGPRYWITAHGEHLFVAWMLPTGPMRTVVYDTTGHRLGHATLAYDLSAFGTPYGLSVGETDAGVRFVVGNGEIVAPCDEL